MIAKTGKQARLISFLCAFAMVGMLSTGCGEKNTNTNTKEDTSSQTSSEKTDVIKEPLKMSIMAPLYNAQPPQIEGNEFLKKLQEYTNTKIEIIFVPSANYYDKVNTVIASGDYPTVMDVMDVKLASFVNAAKSGAFYDVTNSVKSSEKLMKYLNNVTIANTSIDGKLYGVPSLRPVARVGIIYRKDWLNNLGLTPPKNLEEFYQVAKAFTLNDPDKNGKKDTVGFEYCDNGEVETAWSGIDFFVTSQGGFNRWGLKNGNVATYLDTKEYMNVLKVFKKMYDEKLMNDDFALIKGAQKENLFNSGKSGLVVTSIDSVVPKNVTLKKIDPQAEVDFIPVLEGSNGKITNATSGNAGVYAFPKKSVKQEELSRFITYFEKLTDDDMDLLIKKGIENKHWKNEGGKYVATDKEGYSNQVSIFTVIAPTQRYSTFPGDTDDKVRSFNAFSQNAKYAVPNLADPFDSKTWNEKGGELDIISSDARVKFIMGILNEDGFLKQIEKWKAQGGDAVATEYTAAYKKSANK